MSQYIGKTISLISVTDNRYIGLLEDVDSEKGTVTLREVRCFGTEGRKNWGPEEIYPNPTVYKSVKFNGNEVKDLSILDCKLEEVQPVMPPASVMQQHSGTASSLPQQIQQPSEQQQSQFTASVPQQSSPASSQAPQAKVPAAVAGYGVYAPTESESKPVKTVEARQPVQTQLQTREKPLKNRNHGSQQKARSSNEKKVEIPTEDFDFQTSNAKFAKSGNEKPEDDTADDEANRNAGGPDNFYNQKSSFFDNISTSTETNTNMRWQEEKEMNMDTFGQASARSRFGGRGGFRGGRGGRGGRGRGRGRGSSGSRGRNGFNFNNNNRNNFGNEQSQSQNIEF